MTTLEKRQYKQFVELTKLMKYYADIYTIDDDMVYISSANHRLPLERVGILEPKAHGFLKDFCGIMMIPNVFLEGIKGYSTQNVDVVNTETDLWIHFMKEGEDKESFKASRLVFDRNVAVGEKLKDTGIDESWEVPFEDPEELSPEMKKELGIDLTQTARDRVLNEFYDTDHSWFKHLKTANFKDISQEDVAAMNARTAITHEDKDLFIILTKELFPRMKDSSEISVARIGEEETKVWALLREKHDIVTLYSFVKCRKLK